MDNLRPFLELGATAVIALSLLQLVKSAINRMTGALLINLTQRQTEIVATQEKISVILENHLGAIGQHMAASNVILKELHDTSTQAEHYMAITSQAIAQIQNKLLDAVLVPITKSGSTKVEVHSERPSE